MEDPPGFVVRTEAQKAAWDNGYRLEHGVEGGWLHYASTTMERLAYALDDRFYGLDGSHLARFRRMMNELSREEVNAAVRKRLQCANMHIVFVTRDGKALRDALVHNAGFGVFGPVEEVDATATAHQFAVNVLGQLALTAGLVLLLKDPTTLVDVSNFLVTQLSGSQFPVRVFDLRF